MNCLLQVLQFVLQAWLESRGTLLLTIFIGAEFLIPEHIDNNTQFDGEIEFDDSYLSSHSKVQRGREGPKKASFGLFKCGGKVDVKVISNTKSRTLLPIIESKIYPDSTSIPIVLHATMFWK